MSKTLYLLDTNAVSEAPKAQPNPNVTAFFSGVPVESLYISVLTFGELRKGVIVKRRTDPRTADDLAGWIDRLEQTHGDRILPIDHATATLWGKLSADRTRPVVDTLLAATAIVHNLTLVTRNTRDVQDLPVRLHNPWLA